MAHPMRVTPAGACGMMLVNAKITNAAAIVTAQITVNAFARTPFPASAPSGTHSWYLHARRSAGRERNLLTKNVISITWAAAKKDICPMKLPAAPI